MRVIIQSEASECALASLAMVCSAHGLQVDLADLRRRFVVSMKGATMQQLVQHADGLNFSSRPLRLELDELQQLQLPCILHWAEPFCGFGHSAKKIHLGLRPCCG